jgi:integrase
MPKVVEPLTDEEMDKFMAGLEALKASKGKEGIALWIWPAISMLVVYGLRAGVDLCNIQRAEVTSALRTGVLRLWTKGGRIRELPAGVIQEELEWLVSIPNWSVLSDLIAPNAKKPQESAYSAVSKMIKVVAQVGGLDPDTIHPHRLRHAAAMRLYESSGHDLHLVQYLLGHSQIDTTAKYLRVNRMDELNDQLMRVKRNKSRIEDD